MGLTAEDGGQRTEDRKEPPKCYFTFGWGQQYFGCFCVVFGDEKFARETMNRRFSGKWSMCYSEEQWLATDQVRKFGLKELK